MPSRSRRRPAPRGTEDAPEPTRSSSPTSALGNSDLRELLQGREASLPHQSEMEARFGVDLSHIRAFLGEDEALEPLQAQAATHDDVIAFADDSPPREVVAHEVAHVAQGGAHGTGVASPEHPAEQEAEQAAEAALRGETPELQEQADGGVHRFFGIFGRGRPRFRMPEIERTERRARDRAEDLEKVTLDDGRHYTLTEADMASGDVDQIWNTIAREHGMSPEKLMPFNQHIVELDLGFGNPLKFTETTELSPGAEIYIPSAQEIVFAECREKAGSYEDAVELYGKMEEGHNIRLLDQARARASGRLGEGYGTRGVDGGRFLTPNPQVNGASRRNSETIDDQTEYRVFWLESFWKCSVFMHDVVFAAGYEPHMNPNNHYLLAGRLHQSNKFEEIPVEDARPGDCWQRFGGTGTNESHNAILSSFVKIEDIDEEHDKWTFDIIGSESERAAESTRDHKMLKGTNENTDGKRVRFFRPRNER